MLIEGESFVLGVDFSSSNGTLRGELKKVFSFEEVESLNKLNNSNDNKNVNINLQTLQIYADGNFTKDELEKLNLTKGLSKIEIIINNQLLRLPGKFNITSELIDRIRVLKGVKKINYI